MSTGSARARSLGADGHIGYYDFARPKGRILRCYHVDRDRTFGLLFQRIQRAYPLGR